jgi:hypothetical protein
MGPLPHFAAALGLCLAAAAGQQPSRAHQVLVQMPGTDPVSRVVAVDAQSGAVALRGRFDGDTLPPLAIALDPYDGDTLVAVDTGAGSSRILRIAGDPSGGSQILAEVPGKVVDLVVQGDSLAIAVDDQEGGVFRMGRRGGEATRVFAHPNVTAIAGFALDQTAMLVAWSARPGTPVNDTAVAMIDGVSGAFLYGPLQLSNPANREITGIVDLPTGVPCELVSWSDGRFSTVLGGGIVVSTLSVVPQPPPGGAVAMRLLNDGVLGAFVLGGAAMPFLYAVDVFGGTATLRSTALPGTPVDFAYGLTLAAHTEMFGSPCGAPALTAEVTGSAQPGNAITFQAGGAVPGSALFLCAGASDTGGFLPLSLPFLAGCLLHVTPDIAVMRAANATGNAQQPFAVPFSAMLIGQRLFAQWLAPGLGASPAAAVQVGL